MTIVPRVRPLLGEPASLAGKPSVVRAFFGDGADADAEGDAVSGVPSAIACDHAALVSVYGELAPKVHRFLRDLLGDPTLASDATQETFVRAFRRVDELPRTTRLVPWVFGVARFVALEMRKARGRVRRVIDEGVATDDRTVDTRARNPEDALLDREAVAVVERALGRLPEERRAALLLRCDHGLAYDEIAPLMGWSLAKVKVEIFRAREVLRATLEEYRGGGT
ncbi:MAG TPA: RNA polymerase sigma factor [Polyangiaceae bacterium]